MKPKFKRAFLALTTSAVAVIPTSLSAATVMFTGNGDGISFEDGANWDGGNPPANNLTSDIADFDGIDVELSTPRQIGGLLFFFGSTLSGSGSIEIGTSGIEVEDDSEIGTGLIFNQATTNINLVNGDLDVTGVISGTGAVSINNTGGGERTTHWFADNRATFGGDITVGSGAILRVERYSLGVDATAFPDGASITLDGGEITGDGEHLEMTGRNSIVLTENGGTLRHAHARNVYGLNDTVISGPGRLTLAGENSSAGRLQLQGTNTYSGGTLITDGGQAWVYSDASLGEAETMVTFDNGTYYTANNVNLGIRPIVIESGGAIFNMNVRTVTIDGPISGPGGLTVFNGGNLNIASINNTYAGGTTVDGSQINLYGAVEALGTGDITLDNGGTLKNRENHPNISNNIILGDGVIDTEGGETVDGGEFEAGWNKSLTLSGIVSGSGKAIVNPDSGSVRFTNHNTYAGGTDIYGIVLATHSDSLGTGDIFLDGGKLQNLDSGPVFVQNVEISENGAELQSGWNKRTTFSGVISGPGMITFPSDSGTVLLFGSNTYAGGSAIYGKVAVQQDTALGTGDVTIDGGLLQNWDSDPQLANSITVGEGGATFVAGWDKSLNLNGVISGAGDVTIGTDNGVVYLNGVNTYTGDTTVDGGTVALNGSSLNDTTTLSLVNNGVANLVGTEVVSGLNIEGVAQAEGTYGATGSGADNIDDTYFTGTGVVQVATVTGYAGWAGAFAGGQAADEDFDGDGVDNGIEYFLNAPAGFTEGPVLTDDLSISWVNGGNIPSSEYGSQFVIQTSDDLVDWDDVEASDFNLDNTEDAVTYFLPETEEKLFVRLKVTPN